MSKRVLLTGATGFVGEHLYPLLVARGFDVLCGTRQAREAAKRDPHKRFVHIDLADPPSTLAALRQVDRAVYLVHSMGDVDAFADAERRNAETFARAAEEAKLERIVYLGGMRPSGKVSRHLESRLHTGEILRGGAVPTVEVQATMILGGGSESFRIVRDLAARLPFMLFPAWLKSKSEPLAMSDIGAALVHALAMPIDGSSVFGAPGPEVLTGRDIILRAAALLDHAPAAADVPFVTPRLSSYWIRLVTRANPTVATELVEGLRSDILAAGPEIWSRMPHHVRLSFDAAVRAALAEEEETLSPATRWFERVLDALIPSTPISSTPISSTKAARKRVAGGPVGAISARPRESQG